ncbi:MAG: T9SS type A sorting domain-containing protein [Bacteroidota bacterium]|nr:T9SS type A sorting domain-containing protein [Bacteroidota bacterium]MDP3145625.1 T9SS type A sorting domain-containing protein [Bacteroidota bacterium]
MRKIKFIVVLFLIVFRIVSQTPSLGCNQSTTNINSIFYSNTITNITSTLTSFSGMFLCGPNTIVYDTSNVTQGPFVCRTAFVSPSSTLITNSWACAYYEVYFVKNNATIIFTSNTNNNGVHVYYEPGAIIIDNSPGVNTYSCTSISFPTVNCAPNGIKETKANTSIFEIYPNPVDERLNVEFASDEKEFTKAEIINSIGQEVKEIDLDYNSNKTTINMNEFQNGIYTLKLSSRGTRDLNSDSSYRRNDNILSATKRFVISR